MATVTRLWNRWQDTGYDAELPLRIRHFVWLSTGMFSAAALALAFLGYLWTETFANAASNFLASIVSGRFSGFPSFLSFGPTPAGFSPAKPVPPPPPFRRAPPRTRGTPRAPPDPRGFPPPPP